MDIYIYIHIYIYMYVCMYVMIIHMYIYIWVNPYMYCISICEQFDPCSGLSLLIVVPVVLVMQGNVTAWHSENGLFPHA